MNQAGERPARGVADLLARADFVRLWSAGAIAGSLRWLEILALGLYTLAITDSALAVSLMLFARTLPGVVLGPLTGALADRVDRRRLLAGGLAAAALVSGALWALAWSDSLALWHVAAGAFLGGIVWTLEHPVRRTLIGEVVGTPRIGAAISLDSATFNGTRMVGPLVGGAVYAALGLTGAYAVACIAYGAAALTVAGLPRGLGGASARSTPFVATLAEGLAHVRRERVLAGVMVVTMAVNLFGFSYAAMLPVIGERTLGLNALGIGALASMEGLGAFAGALALAFSARPGHYARIFLAGGALFLLMLLAFARSKEPGLAAGALLAGGLGVACFGAMQSTVVLSVTPVDARARVMGVLVTCIGAGPIGVLAVGFLAERVGAQGALTAMSGAGLVTLVLAARLWPELTRALPTRPLARPGDSC